MNAKIFSVVVSVVLVVSLVVMFIGVVGIAIGAFPPLVGAPLAMMGMAFVAAALTASLR